VKRVFTIGYEAAAQAQVIAALKAAGVKLVIDVRAVAASRRAGFSKTILGSSLKDEGIDYLHLRALGTPKAGRDAAKAGRTGEMRSIFAAHMAEPGAAVAFEEAAQIAAARPSALLCFEADPGHCHRRILADRLAAEHGFEVVDLHVSL
jgi:uncharacterized protein (DUF488 family)